MKTLSAYSKAAQLVKAVNDSEARIDALDLLRLCGRDYLEQNKPGVYVNAKDTHAIVEAVYRMALSRRAVAPNDVPIASIVRYVIRADAVERIEAANESMFTNMKSLSQERVRAVVLRSREQGKEVKNVG